MSRSSVACGTSLGLRAGGSRCDPDLLPFGLAARLRGLRLDPIEPITEPPGNRSTRRIGLVGMDFNAVNVIGAVVPALPERGPIWAPIGSGLVRHARRCPTGYSSIMRRSASLRGSCGVGAERPP